MALTAMTMLNAKNEPVIVLEGDLSFWTANGKLATIDIDWNDAEVVEFGNKDKVKDDFGTIDQYNKKQGEDYVNDWPAVKQTVLTTASMFANMTNKKKGLKIITPQEPATLEAIKNMTDEQKAELKAAQAKAEKRHLLYRDYDLATYDIKVHVDTIDMGNAAASAFASLAGEGQYRGGAVLIGTMEVRNRQTQELVCKLQFDHLKGRGSYAETARLGNVYWRLWGEELPAMIKAAGKKKK